MEDFIIPGEVEELLTTAWPFETYYIYRHSTSTFSMLKKSGTSPVG
jgi:hypothetical protein